MTLERRRSDFELDAPVTPFTGSCCSCCCCLHWIGAVAGGVVGMRLGWRIGVQKAGHAPHPLVRRTLLLGLLAGALGAVALTAACAAVYSDGLIALALAPSLVFIPVGAGMVLASRALRARMLSAFYRATKELPAAEGPTTSLYRAKLQAAIQTRDDLADFHVFCRHCWQPLDDAMRLAACPECHAPIARPVLSGPDHGVGLAWRAALMGVGLSTAGTVVGYVVMYVLAVIFK
jgi:hypothetical protein